jgi:hypothetical protein
MSAQSEWKNQYKLLQEFISAHPQIVLSHSEISIPQQWRSEFYDRFDQIRKSFVEEHYPSLTAPIGQLHENYLRVEKQVLELLKVQEISMPVDLHSFLHSPKEGLARAIYNRLFDLLQGKIAPDAFEVLSLNELQSASADLFRLGYEPWTALVLIRFLEPDEAYFVDLDDDYKPFLTELKSISFGRQAHHPTIRIPEFVLHSRRLDSYVGVKMALAREVETFVVPFQPPVRPKKRTGDTSFALDTRVLLLYLMPAREEIPIVAEIYERKLTHPDLMVEYMTENEYEDAAAAGLVVQHLESLSPKLGTYLIVVNPGEKKRPEPPDRNIQVIAAGFDEARLQPIIDKLIKSPQA